MLVCYVDLLIYLKKNEHEAYINTLELTEMHEKQSDSSILVLERGFLV